jgi:hypothetical protein
MAYSGNFKENSRYRVSKPWARKVKKGAKMDYQSIGDIVPKTFANHGMQRDFYQWKVFSIWNATIGKPIAQFAQPTKLFRGTLTVAVKNSTWMQELQFMKQEMIDRLNREISKLQSPKDEQIPLELTPIKDLRFFLATKIRAWVDENQGDSQEKRLEDPFPTAPPEVIARAQELTQDIKDEELRTLFQRLYLRVQKNEK